MKKLFAPLICALLCAVVLCTPALAAGEAPSVVINGEPMEVSDAPAKLVQGRTMIPFRSVFLALGFADEDIHWNSATRTISATKGTVTVSFTIDQKQVTVLRDGDAVTTPTDVAPYLDPETNRTYIPARYVAEALDCRVGWDAQRRTVIIDDVNALLANNQETYELMEQYQLWTQRFQSQSWQTQGSFTVDQNKGELVMACDNFTMYATGTGSELEGTIRLSGSGAAGLPSAIDAVVRGDSQTGAYYFHSKSLMEEGAEVGAATVWYQMEYGSDSQTPGESVYGDLLEWADPEQTDGTYEDLIRSKLEALPLDNAEMTCADLLALYNRLAGDSGFERREEGYVNSFSQGGRTYSLVLKGSREGINGYTMRASYPDPDGVQVSVESSMSQTEMKLSLQRSNPYTGKSLTMEAEGTLKVTDRPALTAPPNSAVIVSLDRLAEFSR